MTKKEALKNITIDKLGNTIFIQNKFISFSYTPGDDYMIKDEYKGKFRYFGGLQCGFPEGSPEYYNIETWLCELAEMILKF